MDRQWKTLTVDLEDFIGVTNPMEYLYNSLLDMGCPIAPNGNLNPGIQGEVCYTMDGRSMTLSWREVDDYDK